MGAEYLSYVKFIATEVPTFFEYIISVLASVLFQDSEETIHSAEKKLPHMKAFSLCIDKKFFFEKPNNQKQKN